MERVLPPQHRDVLGVGARLERTVEPPEPIGDELLAADAHIGEAGAPRVTGEVARRERVDVHAPLELMVDAVGGPGSGRGWSGAGAQQRPPGWSEPLRPRLRDCGETVAEARRLAGEDDPPARSQHAVELGERALQIGEVVQHRVAEHQVKARFCERERLRVGAGRPDAEAEPIGVDRERGQHPRRDVGARRLLDDARLEHVQAEVAGAGADLERTAVAAVEGGAEQLAQLAGHLRLSDLAEVDPPLGVVARRSDVVVARVDVADLIRGAGGRRCGCLHGGRHITLSTCQ